MRRLIAMNPAVPRSLTRVSAVPPPPTIVGAPSMKGNPRPCRSLVEFGMSMRHWRNRAALRQRRTSEGRASCRCSTAPG